MATIENYFQHQSPVIYLDIGLYIYGILFNGFVFNFTFPADGSQIPQKAALTCGVAAGESDWVLQDTGTEHAAPGIRGAAHLPRLLAVFL